MINEDFFDFSYCFCHPCEPAVAGSICSVLWPHASSYTVELKPFCSVCKRRLELHTVCA